MSINAPNLKPMTAGDILDQAIRLYRQNFVPLITIVAIVQLPLIILQALGVASILPATNNFNSSSETTPALFAVLGVAFLFLGIVGGIFVLFQAGALVSFVSEKLLGRSITVRQAYGNAFRRGLSLFIAALLWGLAVFGILAILFLVLFIPLIGGVTALGVSGSNAGALAGLGTLCFCVLLIPLLLGVAYLGTRWTFWVQAILIERYNSTGGLGRSWKLVKGSFWRVLGFLFLLGILNYFLTLGPATALSVAVVFLPQGFGLLVQTLVSGLIGILVAPISYLTLTVLYYDLRIRREGFDLQMQMQNSSNPDSPLDLTSLLPGST